MKKFRLQGGVESPVTITITPLELEITQSPKLLVKIKTPFREQNKEILCESFSVGDAEYVAQRSVYDWYNRSLIGERNNLESKVRLPNGEEIPEKEYLERYIYEKGIFD